jgi:hypothetical protein
MPLTKTGKKILKDYKKRYGKKRGKSNFYATINKYPTRTKSWHKMRRKKRRKRKKKIGLAAASKATRKRVARMGGKAS